MKFTNLDRKIQLTLDCGQKSFGSTRCNQCQMIYTIGDKEDIKAHKEYHRSKLFPVVRVPRGRHEHIIQENFDGSRIVELLTDGRLGQSFYEKIASLMSHDLGYDRPSADTKSFSSNETGTSLQFDWRVFVYIIDRTQQVVGCCVVEELTEKKISAKGYKLNRLVGGRETLLSWSVQSVDKNRTNHNNSVPSYPDVSSPTDLNGPICGVRRLWVEQKHRRKKIATGLLDAVLRNLIYSFPLSRAQVAFAEPTANGADFAVSYVGREDFLLY
uniref:N-acetyltransferase ESCO1 n=1 Tax=Trichobilharzia regenti TaxID=157069 RepID=A0AA85K327_TRIRE|nr:unnamed protein product [Trichobilharzia regenti]